MNAAVDTIVSVHTRAWGSPLGVADKSSSSVMVGQPALRRPVLRPACVERLRRAPVVQVAQPREPVVAQPAVMMFSRARDTERSARAVVVSAGGMAPVEPGSRELSTANRLSWPMSWPAESVASPRTTPPVE